MINDIPTYYDICYQNCSKIFEAEQIKGFTPDQIQEGEKLYKQLLEKLEKNEPIDEGIFGGLVAAGASALIGPAIMKSLCKCLGIEENGTLGKLLTSKLVLASLAYTAFK